MKIDLEDGTVCLQTFGHTICPLNYILICMKYLADGFTGMQSINFVWPLGQLIRLPFLEVLQSLARTCHPASFGYLSGRCALHEEGLE